MYYYYAGDHSLTLTLQRDIADGTFAAYNLPLVTQKQYGGAHGHGQILIIFSFLFHNIDLYLSKSVGLASMY